MGERASAIAAPDPGLLCPHCHVALPLGWSGDRAGRCPTCRLLIGVHRATAAREGEAQHGGAAGVLASAARRARAESGDPTVVRTAMRAAAADRGVAVARLGMLEYDRFTERDPSAPSLAVVMATFTTWKNARTQASLQ